MAIVLRSQVQLTASCSELARYFENKRCANRHEHMPNAGALGKRDIYANAEVWTWKEVEAVIDGIQLCFKLESHGRNVPSSFPVDVRKIARAQPGSAPHPGRDHGAPAPQVSPCKACRGFEARSDWEHSRLIGERSFPYDEQVIWSCEACLKRWPRERGHTMIQGECKWAVAGYR